MSRSPFSRLSLCAAAIGALAIAAFAAAPSRAAEDAVIIPAPADRCPGHRRHPDRRGRGRLLLGRAGRVPAHRRRRQRGVRLCRRQQEHRRLRHRLHRHHRPCRVRRDQIRPKKISYGKILQIFFSVAHDPTQLNRQGPDSGTQYRSAIFTTSDEQKKVADAYIAQLNAAKVYRKPIVTKVGPLEGFYPAEAYHQDYLTLHPNQPYIAYNDIPKVENLKKIFARKLHREADAGERRKGHQLTAASDSKTKEVSQCPTPRRCPARSRRARPNGARN